MSLRRTSSALSSMHVFYKSDVIVFCEGGQPKAISDALTYGPDARNLDNIFWSAMLGLLNIGKKLHFKSVGRKTTLLEIAKDIRENNVDTVSVCLDSDYDVILGKKFDLPKIAYTYGYSWESDVLDTEVLLQIVSTLVGQIPNDRVEGIKTNLDQIDIDLSKWFEIDISLRKQNKPCVFERTNPLSSVDINVAPISVAHSRLRVKTASRCCKGAGFVIRGRRLQHGGGDGGPVLALG